MLLQRIYFELFCSKDERARDLCQIHDGRSEIICHRYGIEPVERGEALWAAVGAS